MKKPNGELEPTILTIFGITGDLSRQRLLPSLYQLEKNQSLPKDCYIVGVSRQPFTTADLKKAITAHLRGRRDSVDQPALQRLSRRLHTTQADVTGSRDFPKLKNFLDKLEERAGVCLNRLFYLSIPPSLFAPVVEQLGAANLHRGCQHGRADSRILIEKPFGYNLESAQELIKRIGRYFKEPQIYRIDHYLAKETVQNIIQFRFANPLIEAIWNRQFVDHVQITVAEEIGIGFRVDFYEGTGALRDILQSHILQLLALAAMERPARLNPEHIQGARAALLKAIAPIKSNQVSQVAVRGQYTAGRVGGKPVKGYRQEVGNPKSLVETYAAAKFSVDTPRWRGTPFIVRTGKRLDDQELTEIVLVFKDRTRHQRPSNTLTLRIEPDEGIILDLLVKQPGLTNDTQPVEMDFRYERSFGANRVQLSAYERLLLNAIQGDRTLFTTSQEMLASWRAVQPILHAWEGTATGLEFYRAGSQGPAGADKLARRYGCEWLNNQV